MAKGHSMPIAYSVCMIRMRLCDSNIYAYRKTLGTRGDRLTEGQNSRLDD